LSMRSAPLGYLSSTAFEAINGEEVIEEVA
jgi:hypothetical protein